VDTFTDGAELKLVGNFSGFNAVASGSYYRRRRWERWAIRPRPSSTRNRRSTGNISLSVSKDRYFSGFRKLHLGLSYQSAATSTAFSKYEFGSFSGNPVRGYKSGSLRTERDRRQHLVRVEHRGHHPPEAFYDQALLKDTRSGFNNTYFSGAGLLASLNGPWRTP
jgi:hypothetical protein